jgi:hypothetical protein
MIDCVAALSRHVGASRGTISLMEIAEIDELHYVAS